MLMVPLQMAHSNVELTLVPSYDTRIGQVDEIDQSTVCMLEAHFSKDTCLIRSWLICLAVKGGAEKGRRGHQSTTGASLNGGPSLTAVYSSNDLCQQGQHHFPTAPSLSSQCSLLDAGQVLEAVQQGQVKDVVSRRGLAIGLPARQPPAALPEAPPAARTAKSQGCRFPQIGTAGRGCTA